MKAKEILVQARVENRTVLTEIEAKQILMEAGINCTDTRLAVTKDAALKLSEQFGYPVVLKVSSVDITHKTDAGGVKVNLQNKAEVENAFDAIMRSCKAAVPAAMIEGVSVQVRANPVLKSSWA
jgi:acyl-CoA synthetase (NDP forming)